MCAQRKVCVKKEHTMGIMKEIYKFQLLTLTLFVFCASFGVTQGVSTEIAEEKEGIYSVINNIRKFSSNIKFIF